MVRNQSVTAQIGSVQSRAETASSGLPSPNITPVDLAFCVSKTFTFEFEELPLVISNGIEAAFINGAAGIQYSRDGQWQIDGITVEGFGDRVNGKRVWPQVPAPFNLMVIIAERLETEWSGKVQNAVNEQIAGDREDAADMRADMRRDHMMGL